MAWRYALRCQHQRYLSGKEPWLIPLRLSLQREAEFEATLEQRGRKAREAFLAATEQK